MKQVDLGGPSWPLDFPEENLESAAGSGGAVRHIAQDCDVAATRPGRRGVRRTGVHPAVVDGLCSSPFLMEV